VRCKSSFYSAQDCLSNNSHYALTQGINKLVGEIDSGIWAISYLLSMYKHRPKDFALFEEPNVMVNNCIISLNELSGLVCYMDNIDPLFTDGNSIKKLIMRGLKRSKLNYSCEDIQKLFCIDSERFERPLTGVGNEIFKAMAAIGFSYKKEVFCFPWMSNNRFEYYHENLKVILEILENQEKVVIVPVGISNKNI